MSNVNRLVEVLRQAHQSLGDDALNNPRRLVPFVNDAAPDVRGAIGHVAKVLELGGLRRLSTAQDLAAERAGLKQQAMAGGLSDVQAEEAIAAILGFANMPQGAGAPPLGQPAPGQPVPGQPVAAQPAGNFGGAPQATPIAATPKKSNTVSIIVGLVVAVVGGGYVGQVIGLWDLRNLTGGGGGGYEAMPQPRMPDPQERGAPQSNPMPQSGPITAGGNLPLVSGNEGTLPVIQREQIDGFHLYRFLAPAGNNQVQVIIGVNRQGWDAPGGILIRPPDGSERPRSDSEGRSFIAERDGDWALRVYQARSFDPDEIGIGQACVVFGKPNVRDVPFEGDVGMCLYSDSNCSNLVGCAQIR